MLVTLALLLAGAFSSQATSQQVVFQLTNVIIQNGSSISGSSQALLPAAAAYAYVISGTCHATGNLAFLITGTETIQQAMDKLSANFYEQYLVGTVANPGGLLPFVVVDKVASGNFAGVGSASAEFHVNVDASGRASFSVDNISFQVFGSPDSSQLIIDNATVTTTAVLTPVVTTGTATLVTGSTATLSATVNPNGDNTNVNFLYGTSPSYGLTSGTQVLAAGLSGSLVTVNLTGLTPGQVYHFNVSAANTSGTGGGGDVVFQTLGAVSGTAPAVITAPAASVTATTAQISGSVNPNGLPASAFFEYGTTAAYGSIVGPQAVGSGTVPVTVNGSLFGLSPGQTYHFRLSGSNSAGLVSGSDQMFTTQAQVAAPSVTTNPATSVTATSAQINGSVTPNGLATMAYFDYGTTTQYGSTVGPQATGSGNTPVTINGNLFGLTPGQTYHFRLSGSNSMGLVSGSDQTFTTLTQAAAPAVTTNPATSVGISAAALNGAVNPNGAATTVSFDYGLTGSFGSTTTSQVVASGTSPVAVSANLASLLSGTTYYFRVTGSNSVGVTTGSTQSFVTLTAPAPSVTTGSATVTGTGTATLTATVNPHGTATSVQFLYGTGTGYGLMSASTSVGSGSSAVQVSVNVAGLTPATLYHYQAFASAISGTFGGGDSTFSTNFAFKPYAGKYAQEFSEGSFMTTGIAGISVTAAGSFSAAVKAGALALRFSGKFSQSGAASVTLKSNYKLTLQLGQLAGAPVITGSLSGFPVAVGIGVVMGPQFVAHKIFSGKMTPVRYTAQIPQSVNSAIPQGIGYATLSVSKSGAIKLSGKMNDGTTVTAGGPILADGTWPFFSLLYKKMGSAAGIVSLPSQASPNPGSTVNWFKPATSGSYTPGGFSTTLTMFLDQYVAPAPGHPVVSVTSGNLALASGGLVSAISVPVTLTTANKIVVSSTTAGLEVSIDAPKGLFSGSFVDPTDKKLRTFTGAILIDGTTQGAYGVGVFEGATQAGSVELFPVP